MKGGTVRHVWSQAEDRWYEIRMDYREPAIVHVKPMSGIGARSRPTVVSSLEAAIDFINKQTKGDTK